MLPSASAASLDEHPCPAQSTGMSHTYFPTAHCISLPSNAYRALGVLESEVCVAMCSKVAVQPTTGSMVRHADALHPWNAILGARDDS